MCKDSTRAVRRGAGAGGRQPSIAMSNALATWGP
ncbi:hypothetical protein SCE1572_52400 [Sorangium cellulosum So0157-2]|uniref:Uncharacterized protein n=1 Tax=Sorangium cellulosum So0157-2 TaxID=1254432 RepID=S4YDC8_SORCE|nr:hypothetical protein SCE1572_52400 [Sorangium cellulosum So0157-2]